MPYQLLFSASSGRRPRARPTPRFPPRPNAPPGRRSGNSELLVRNGIGIPRARRNTIRASGAAVVCGMTSNPGAGVCPRPPSTVARGRSSPSSPSPGGHRIEHRGARGGRPVDVDVDDLAERGVQRLDQLGQFPGDRGGVRPPRPVDIGPSAGHSVSRTGLAVRRPPRSPFISGAVRVVVVAVPENTGCWTGSSDFATEGYSTASGRWENRVRCSHAELLRHCRVDRNGRVESEADREKRMPRRQPVPAYTIYLHEGYTRRGRAPCGPACDH